MNIDVRRFGGTTKYYDLKFNFRGASVREEDVDQDEVDTIAVAFIEDTLLAPLNRYEVIDRLIEVGILSKEQINSWVKEQASYD